VRINDDPNDPAVTGHANVLNVLNTIPNTGSASSPDALTWGPFNLWTSGNDGPGSGLDADTLDGMSSSAFAAASHDHDSRYYTQSQSDARYLGATAKAADSDQLDGLDSTQLAKTSESTRVVRGSVNPSGGVDAGSGFSVSWGGCGSYTVTFSPAFGGTPTVVTGAYTSSPVFVALTSVSSSQASVQTWNQAGSCDSRGFQFVAAGPG